ncbi:MAG: hypothetical protein HZA66_22065 [Rhodopseudomonas palustris]|uniref:Uncharacterized protein n=1 Tax=Rhodopseudomonas palustris TaxID=1076 RepID=A0A933S4Z6_RHOPL|nr:hypothetical protein [Rhodopseudomonas palustris]
MSQLHRVAVGRDYLPKPISRASAARGSDFNITTLAIARIGRSAAATERNDFGQCALIRLMEERHMTNDPRVTSAKTDGGQAVAGRVAAAVKKIRTAGSPGEMSLQNLFGHPATQSIPQGLVRLVGYRDPARPAALGRPSR